MDSRQARKNFGRVLAGKPPRRRLSPVEAKARLRAADPGIDISRPLARLNRGETAEAGAALAVETVVALALPFLRSLLGRAAEGLLTGSRSRRRD